MPAERVDINGPDGSFSGYLAKPASGAGPGVVVIQEIFGVNDVMRNICDDLAASGYFALCPDLFWRIEPGIELSDQKEDELARAFDLFGKFQADTGIADIAATIAHLRGVEGCSGKVGAVGFCLGGLLAYLTAARTDIDAAVGFYGVSIDQHLGEAASIKKPLLLHVAEEDEFVSKDQQEAMRAGLKDHPLTTLIFYPGYGHAFARVGGAHYDKSAATAANVRTMEFFQEHLS